MTSYLSTRYNRMVAHLLLSGVIVVFLLVACESRSSTQVQTGGVEISSDVAPTNVAPTNVAPTIKLGQINAEPLPEMLPQISSVYQQRIEEFAATVPKPLPNDLAFPQVMFFEPTLSGSNGTRIVKLLDGLVILKGILVNPGSNFNQTNVICLRNEVQVSCAPAADVWEVSLAPETLAIVPYQVESKRGDLLTFLFIANNEPKRVNVASGMLSLFVEEEPASLTSFAQAPGHEKVFDGCDFSLILTENPESDIREIRIPGTQKRGTMLYLVFQTCEPVTDELVRLVAIVDRSRVINMPGEVWHSPVRLANPATVIPIDTGLLGDTQEFQVAVVPLANSTTEPPDWWGWFPFTPAVALTD